MCVFPVLLLLMQLMVAVQGAANVSASGNASVPNVNTTTVLSPVKNNATVGATITTNTSIAPRPTNETMHIQDKVNTMSTVQAAATSAKPTTASTTTTVTIQTPQAINATANATQITKTPSKLDKSLTEAGVSQSDINSNNSSGSKLTPAGSGNGSTVSKSSSTITTSKSSFTKTKTPSTATSTTTTTSTSTTTTTTTTTTTARPLKPKKTIPMDHQLPGENNQSAVNNNDGVDQASIKSDPISESVREMVSRPNHDENEYIVPIVAVMLTVPIAFVVFIIMYRRFRDLWTTRHYRRMDFLVDGMYND